MNSQGDGKPTTLNKNRTTVKTFLLNILQTLVVAVGMTFIADNAAAQRKVAEPPARIKPANATAADSLNPILAQQDTLRLLDSANKPLLSRNDSLQLRKDSIKIAKKRDWATWRPNPKRAMWLALVLPGAGQIYNRKYWKLPIVYGGFVGCAYALRWNNQMYRDYSQAYLDLMDDDPNTQSYNQFLHLGAKIDDSNKARYQKLFNEVVKNGYSVRKVEEMAQMLKNGEDVESGKKKIIAKTKLPEEFTALKNHLSDFLQTKVQMTCSPKGKGKITIPFANEEELERIMCAFDKMKQE